MIGALLMICANPTRLRDDDQGGGVDTVVPARLEQGLQIRLEPLDESSGGEMASGLREGLRGTRAALEPLVIDNTEGNPFFIEELMHARFEQGVLRRNGALHLARPLGALGIPATVHGIRASRIDVCQRLRRS